jgi:hypothetical protein
MIETEDESNRGAEVKREMDGEDREEMVTFYPGDRQRGG